MNPTNQLAAFVATTTYDDIPPQIRQLARYCFRDHLGVGLLGSQSESGEKMHQYVSVSHKGTTATVLGGETATPQGAALANGTFAHVDDYDDTYESIVIHPSTPVVPAALAAAEAEDSSAEELLTALVVGTEVLFRVGHSVYPEHYDNGWHLTATVGTFGAAAAAASIYDLSESVIEHAFGIAGSAAPTTLKRNMGSTIKLTHPGQGAQRGIEAALMARDGWTANTTIFEGKNGYPAVMAPGRENPTVDVEGLGEQWSLTDVGFKLYPSAIVTHAGIYALEALLEEKGIDGDDLESVEVFVDETIDVLKHPKLAGPFEAKFSFEFCLSLIATYGSVDPEHFSQGFLEDEELNRQMEMITVIPETKLFGANYFGYGARIRVKTTDGETYTREQRTPPAMPYEMSDEGALESKFLECAATVYDDEKVAQLNERLLGLGETHTFEDVRSILTSDVH